jgi:hypothetical protein
MWPSLATRAPRKWGKWRHRRCVEACLTKCPTHWGTALTSIRSRVPPLPQVRMPAVVFQRQQACPFRTEFWPPTSPVTIRVRIQAPHFPRRLPTLSAHSNNSYWPICRVSSWSKITPISTRDVKLTVKFKRFPERKGKFQKIKEMLPHVKKIQ